MQAKSNAAMREHGGADGNRTAASNRSYLYSTVRHSTSQEPIHGRVVGDTWTKSVRASVHQLRAPKAWALDVADLDAAERAGVRVCHIHDMESLRHFWATLATVRAHGFTFERRFGPQIALTLEHWRPTRGEAEEVNEPEPELEPELAGRQARLW